MGRVNPIFSTNQAGDVNYVVVMSSIMCFVTLVIQGGGMAKCWSKFGHSTTLTINVWRIGEKHLAPPYIRNLWERPGVCQLDIFNKCGFVTFVI